jgi:hypothetical protein
VKGMHIGYWRESRKRHIEKPRSKLVDNTELHLKRDRTGWFVLHLSGSGQGLWRALLNTVMSLRFA